MDLRVRDNSINIHYNYTRELFSALFEVEDAYTARTKNLREFEEEVKEGLHQLEETLKQEHDTTNKMIKSINQKKYNTPKKKYINLLPKEYKKKNIFSRIFGT